MKENDFKILIADDSILSRRKLKNCLNSLGYHNIIEAVDGVVAVEMYKAEQPDLVFMDIVMPNKYGIDALTDIIAFCPSAKVVMLSSTGTKSNITDSIKAGAFEFLLKPFTNTQVKEILSRIEKEDK